MKEHTFDAQIIAATPHSDKINSFVKDVMKKINQQQLAGALPRERRGFVSWLQHLHKPAIALAAFIAVVLLSSAAYAAVHFAPALIQMLGKETNGRGATEYSFAGFKDCSKNNYNIAERFEIKKDVNLSDDEVQKIIQAKCELKWLEDFPGKRWPTYGTNTDWKDGDTIYYTRLDMIGNVVSASGSAAKLDFAGHIVDHTPVANEKIRAFAAGEEIAINDIKPGDSVFTISRVSETYHDMSKIPQASEKNPHVSYAMPDNNMKTLGLVALFKLSLPRVYYMEKQGYLTEIPVCVGNEGELCAQTPSIDVYPRGPGESATNPAFMLQPDAIMRQISGTVTELTDDTLTLRSRKGNLFTVAVPNAGFKIYNRDYTAPYADINATLKVGSNVFVYYQQLKTDDAKKILPSQVQMVGLQLEGIAPKNSVKPY